jgi:hypothetical protein
MTEEPANPQTDGWSFEQAFELHKLIANRTNRPTPQTGPDGGGPSADDDHAVKDED